EDALAGSAPVLLRLEGADDCRERHHRTHERTDEPTLEPAGEVSEVSPVGLDDEEHPVCGVRRGQRFDDGHHDATRAQYPPRSNQGVTTDEVDHDVDLLRYILETLVIDVDKGVTA